MRQCRLLALLRRTPSRGGTCGACTHFRDDPHTIEAMLPGLRAMGSGFASVRGRDGICTLRDVILSHDAGCARFEPHAADP
jgi:hypothetical protein